jgi:hypothetical protein
MPDPASSFYSSLPVFRGFANVTDPARYRPLPDGWIVGVADVADSTAAVRAQRYKEVNMAGAAVIAAITNALGHRNFPFVFGGDGASFAVPPEYEPAARTAMAATAAWVGEELGLRLRIGMVPVAELRARGADVRLARFAASDNVALAMFHGEGLAVADAAVKAGEFAVAAAQGARPDLSGLSCRFDEIAASRGLILSLLVVPAPGVDAERVRAVLEETIRLTERDPDASGPVPHKLPRLRWPPQGLDLEARAQRRTGESLAVRKARVLAWTLLSYLIFRLGIAVGRFSPEKYSREVVENSDFRKFDGTLRMVIDCTPALADEVEAMLSAAAAEGIVRFGMHRQDKAVMTCFTPDPVDPGHVHFIDGAAGGYTTAAVALKAGLSQPAAVR